MFIGQWTLSLPHTNVHFDPPLSLSRTLHFYTSHTFPCPLTSHCTRVQGWHTLRPLYNTESHPFFHLMGQGPLKLLSIHAPAVHAKMRKASRFCVSSLRRGHANLLCIVPILVQVPPKRVQDSIPDRPARSAGAIPTKLPEPHNMYRVRQKNIYTL